MKNNWNWIIKYFFIGLITIAGLVGVYFFSKMEWRIAHVVNNDDLLSYPESMPVSLPLEEPAVDAVIQTAYANQELRYRNTEIFISSDKPLKLVDIPENWEWNYGLGEDPGEFVYVATTADIPDGTHDFSITVKDEDGFSEELAVRLAAPAGRPVAPTWKRTDYFTKPESLLAVANKQVRLSMYYEPGDLVSLSDYGIANYNGSRLRKLVIKDLHEMTLAIKDAGIDATVTSGYRSYDSQVTVYNSWLDRRDGNVSYVDTFSARAGHSEHQLGTTMDFVTNETPDAFTGFAETRLSAWLAANAHKYGFVISYPEGKQDITGYTYEPWHYRYVGRDNAKLITESGLTLTEWLYDYHNINL